VATHGAFVDHVCRVVRLFPLQGYILIRISVTPSDMGEACSLCPNIGLDLHCWLRIMRMLATLKSRFDNTQLLLLVLPSHA
jgi:hypothetical protein